MFKFILITLSMIFFAKDYCFAQNIYFPPLGGNDWETVSPVSLGWNIKEIDSLYNFLENKNSKAFIVLKGGKIVLEKYFDSFTKDSNWYWASAGKTLTAALIGIAQEEGLLSINDKTSKYLGEGWTSMPLAKEDLITVRHQLTMSTGLDFKVEDLDCTNPECLIYKADAGDQWYYHNAPYTLLDKVVENASGLNYNLYTAQKIRNKIGMNGAWLKTGSNNVYYSTARSMARYGILISNNGDWEGNEIIKDKSYLNQMANTSQELNKSYGYLWWLNGKESSMIPGTSLVFNTMLMPDAPLDAFAALGKNGQILCIAPSNDIIIVRMGNEPDDQFFISSKFTNDIWKYLNKIIGKTSIQDDLKEIELYPNPASEYIEIKQPSEGFEPSEGSAIKIYNTYSECVMTVGANGRSPLQRIDISQLPTGIYFIQIGNYFEKFVVLM